MYSVSMSFRRAGGGAITRAYIWRFTAPSFPSRRGFLFYAAPNGDARRGRTDNFRPSVVEALDNTASIAGGLRLAQTKILSPCRAAHPVRFGKVERRGETDNFRPSVVESLGNTASIAIKLRLARTKILSPCRAAHPVRFGNVELRGGSRIISVRASLNLSAI